MDLFLRVFGHLLPRTRLWSLALDGFMRRLFEGLTGLPSDARDFIDALWLKLLPPDTDELPAWDEQFGLPESGLSDADRKTRLAAAWSALGGQSPRYLQDVMQANGFDVYIHEWWELPVVGGVPVAHDPRLLLSVSGPTLTILCGEALALCGEALALAGQSIEPLGYPLVNKIATSVTLFLGAGDPEMECNEALASAGAQLSLTLGEVVYLLPNDPDRWAHFTYWGGPVFSNQGIVAAARRDEFEDLLLKLNPGEKWLGVLVDYT